MSHIDLSSIVESPDLEVNLRSRETPAVEAARIAREKAEADHAREQQKADAALARRKDFLTFVGGGMIAIGFFLLGVYLLTLRPGATDKEKDFAITVLTLLAGGVVGFLFGKQGGTGGKSGKD